MPPLRGSGTVTRSAGRRSTVKEQAQSFATCSDDTAVWELPLMLLVMLLLLLLQVSITVPQVTRAACFAGLKCQSSFVVLLVAEEQVQGLCV
jgi:hypothetical protein